MDDRAGGTVSFSVVFLGGPLSLFDPLFDRAEGFGTIWTSVTEALLAFLCFFGPIEPFDPIFDRAEGFGRSLTPILTAPQALADHWPPFWAILSILGLF